MHKLRFYLDEIWWVWNNPEEYPAIQIVVGYWPLTLAFIIGVVVIAWRRAMARG